MVLEVFTAIYKIVPFHRQPTNALPSEATGFPTVIAASALGLDGQVAPSNRVTMGVIGTGNQGLSDLRYFLKDERVQVVAVCDVNRESGGYWNGAIAGREPARRRVEEAYAAQTASGTYRGCDAYADFRELLARDDIDAVEIATRITGTRFPFSKPAWRAKIYIVRNRFP